MNRPCLSFFYWQPKDLGSQEALLHRHVVVDIDGTPPPCSTFFSSFRRNKPCYDVCSPAHLSLIRLIIFIFTGRDGKGGKGRNGKNWERLGRADFSFSVANNTQFCLSFAPLSLFDKRINIHQCYFFSRFRVCPVLACPRRCSFHLFYHCLALLSKLHVQKWNVKIIIVLTSFTLLQGGSNLMDVHERVSFFSLSLAPNNYSFVSPEDQSRTQTRLRPSVLSCHLSYSTILFPIRIS